MQQAILEAARSPSLVTYVVVFAVGALVSLGSCTILELPVLVGYLGGLATRSRKRLFAITLLFVLGMLVSYLVVGLLVSLAAIAANRLIAWSNLLYIILGLISLILGALLLGFLRLPFPGIHAFSHLSKGKASLLGAFVLGLGFVFLEAPACPACAPALALIGSYMVSKQRILSGLLILLTYVAGQSVPILAVGMFAGWAKPLMSKSAQWQEYLRIGGGILLIIVGLDLLWLA